MIRAVSTRGAVGVGTYGACLLWVCVAVGSIRVVVMLGDLMVYG
jgi:hypothetical protein